MKRRYASVTLPFLPFPCITIIHRLPHAFDFMPERYEAPWYQSYTMPIHLLCALYLYSATFIASLFMTSFFGVEASGVAWVIFALTYCALLAYGIYRWIKALRTSPRQLP